MDLNCTREFAEEKADNPVVTAKTGRDLIILAEDWLTLQAEVERLTRELEQVHAD